MTDRSSAGFDRYADSYDESLNRGISVSGEDKFYFSKGRVDWLRNRLRRIRVETTTILDFGCGTGTSIPYLLELPGAKRILAADESRKSIEIGSKQLPSPRVQWIALEDYKPDGGCDLAFSSGVFHHILPDQRPAALQLIRASLRPDGVFALWENNPWNPGTRYVMRRIPFDRDAVPLSAPLACRLVRESGFEVLSVDFLFIFPRWLRWFRWMEPLLAKVPMGAQYQVLCRSRAAERETTS